MMLSATACSSQQSESNKEQSSADSAQAENTAEKTDADTETIFQIALLQSLTQGYYDGIIKVSELKHGDIIIGTFEGVNGEMIMLDGTVYQALGDGTDQEAAEDETVLFSNVTFFDKDGSFEFSDINDRSTLKENGHILDLQFDKATVKYDMTPGLEMCLTDNDDFRKTELSKDVSDAIRKVETNEE